MKNLYFSKIITVGLATCIVASGVALPVSAAPSTPSTGTVVYEDVYKSLALFSKSELETLTGRTLTADNALGMLSALTEAGVWEDAGYTTVDAKRIASRFNGSQDQALSVLKEIARNSQLGLKVVIVDNGYHIAVNIGTEAVDRDVIIPDGESSAGSDSDNGVALPSDPGDTLSHLKEVEIEIEYAKREIDLDYNALKPGKSSYENEITGEVKTGSGAAELAEYVLSGLDLKSASEEEIASHVLNRLGAAGDYKKFQFKLKFTDGSKIDFKLK